MSHPQIEDIRADALSHMEETLARLCSYLTYPAISCDKDHEKDVRALAAQIRDDLEELGLDRARVLEIDGALPSMAAEICNAGPDKPCVLIYGHLDLQPVKNKI